MRACAPCLFSLFVLSVIADFPPEKGALSWGVADGPKQLMIGDEKVKVGHDEEGDEIALDTCPNTHHETSAGDRRLVLLSSRSP